MFCRKCGAEISENAVYCHACGEKISEVSSPTVAQSNESLSVIGPQKMQNEGYLYQFPGRSPDNVAKAVSNLFQQEEYSLEEGNLMDGIYGVGSGGVKRALGGAFSKRYRFRCIIRPIDGVSSLEIYKAMSGMSGGMIGIRKLNKEFERIREALKTL